MKIEEIEAKSILVKSKLPDADYVINPYTGCLYACTYCYASFMGRFVNEKIENWGNYLYVKKNAVEIFEKEIALLYKKAPKSTLLLSSVTDPYQGHEAKYQLTRGILEKLAAINYPGRIGILTKSDLVLRDIDLLKSLPNVEVGLTVTTTDNTIGRMTELKAPKVAKRLEVLKILKDEGLCTYAFIGPLFPHYRFFPEELELLFSAIADTCVDSVFIEHINLNQYILKRVDEFLLGQDENIKMMYQSARSTEHRKVLTSMCNELISKYNLKLRLGSIINHSDL